jgi:hypothetical protein
MELADTVKLMGSLDWKGRLKAEYWQLKLRTEKLESAILNDQVPHACESILQEQLTGMRIYLKAIEDRIKSYDLTSYMNNTSDMV